MKKRLLALLLCLVMVIGLVPFALAEGVEQETQGTVYTRVIHFDANGGVLADNTKDLTVTFPNETETTTLAANNKTLPADPTRVGYTFLGWYATYDPDTGDYRDPFNETSPIPNNRTQKNIYAKWQQKHYTLTLKSGIAGDKDYVNNNVPGGEDFTLPPFATASTGWTVAGKTFAYWKDDGGAPYSDGQTLSTISSDITLTAVYQDSAPTLYKVTYFDNAMNSKAIAHVESGSVITLKLNAGETAQVGGTTITGEGTYTVTADCELNNALKGLKQAIGWKYVSETNTFIPVWEQTPTTVKVTFYCYNHGRNDTISVPANTKLIIDPNYGTYAGSTTKTTITVTSDTTIAEAKRAGYYFYGWYVTESQGVYTFTAVWNNNYYYNTYSIYYYDYDDCKSEYANFPYGTSVVIDPNGGTAKLSGTSFSTKQSFNIYRDYTLTDASRSGYTFYGWDLTKSGSTYYFTAMWSRYKSDVPYMLNGTDHYAYIKGYPNGSFKPTDTITRAEAATIFYRLLTDSTRKAYATSYNTFKDVPATAWYNTAVSTMAKLGIVNGGADGYFRPNDPITRAEIAAMIARCDGAYYTGTSTVFSDTYGHWAAGYIDRAYELGWINGYGTTYAPDRYISRAETVAVLNRVLNRAPQYTSDLTRNYTTFSDVATSAWYYLDVEEAANSHTYTRKSNADYETWTKLIADPSWF